MTGFPTFSSDAGLPGRDDAWEPTILNLRRPANAAPPQSGLLTQSSLLTPPPAGFCLPVRCLPVRSGATTCWQARS